MKYESFDGRWDQDELNALLARDGVDIIIRFITESDYKIRVYYEGKVITYSSSNAAYPSNNWGQMQQQQPMYQSSPQYAHGEGQSGSSSPISTSIRRIFGGDHS